VDYQLRFSNCIAKLTAALLIQMSAMISRRLAVHSASVMAPLARSVGHQSASSPIDLAHIRDRVDERDRRGAGDHRQPEQLHLVRWCCRLQAWLAAGHEAALTVT
jgi:hypothetical protein